MNWLVCTHSWDETFQEWNMAKDIPGLSVGNWSYGPPFSLHIFLNLPTGCFGYLQPSACVALSSVGHFHGAFALLPSCRTSGSGGAIPASAVVNVTNPAKQVHAWPQVLSCPSALPSLSRCFCLAAFMELHGLQVSLNEKYLPSSAWDMKNFGDFLCRGSHPIHPIPFKNSRLSEYVLVLWWK